MRKLIVEEWISLDGYAADVNGATAFFPSTELNKQSDEDQLVLMDHVDTILIGRKTYEIFADFWPKVGVDQEIISDKLNSIPKVVISRTLKNAPWGKWAPATIVGDDAIEAVKKMKQENGKDIVVWGSISLVQTLIAADLVDQYHIQICPVRLGDGRPLFAQGMSNRELQLIDAKVYPHTGVVLLKYVPKL